ncbi:uncharacterized protein LOC125447652 [Stegostoma tigrinum]|uniref:uncharacterized protein LOC125447652 n=1 Tax=Stegostoma tigrinum TaxID=3053191 RepID=UPI00202B51FC|nr:uncharacterized protein LOC125447652 [Stegostoma tigrinum]
MWCRTLSFTESFDQRMFIIKRRSISVLSNGLQFLILAGPVTGQQSGMESHAVSETHSVPVVAALAMSLSAILFLLMLCVLFTPKVVSKYCRSRRKPEDCTTHGDKISLPTYEEAVFKDQVKLCQPSEIISVLPVGPHSLRCSPQTVQCQMLKDFFYKSHFSPSYQMDMALGGTILLGETQLKDLEEPPAYQDIYPRRTDLHTETEKHWILPLRVVPLTAKYELPATPSLEL